MDEAKRLQHTAAQIDEGLDLAFAAAPQSSTYTKNQVDAALADKVDKVTGMGLSTNDFSNAMKTKLTGIESGAEVNVQADWNQTDTMASDYIRNKPTIPEIPKNVSSFVNDAEYTTIEYNSNNERLDININPNGLSQ